MNPLVIEILKQVIIAVAGISIVGATVATGTLGASNLVSRFTQKDHKIAQVQADDSDKKIETEKKDPEDASERTGIGISSTPQSVDVKKSVVTGTVVTPKPTSLVSAQTNTGCIITLSGQQYNVTSLRQSHSGGDIFKCGTDMTSVYLGKHGSSLSRMQQYLVSTIGTSSTGTISGATEMNTNTSRVKNVSEDHESREHEMEKTLEAAKEELEHEDD